MPLRDLEERYHDKRNIRVIGSQKRISFRLEQRLQRGVAADNGRYDSPGFHKGIHPNFMVLGSKDADIWGDDIFDPNGHPYGDAFDPTRDKSEEHICDLHGNEVDGEWSEEDEELLLAEFLEAESHEDDVEEIEEVKILPRPKKRRRGKKRRANYFGPHVRVVKF